MTTLSADPVLYQRLKAEGIADSDALELAAVFGGSDPDLWVEGWLMVAGAAQGQVAAALWTTYPEPWGTFGPAIAKHPVRRRITEFVGLCAQYQLDTQNALQAAFSVACNRAAQAGAAPPPKRPTPGIPSVKQATAIPQAKKLEPIDKQFAARLQRTLNGQGQAAVRRKRAGELLQDWLFKNGRLIHTPGGRRFYLFRRDSRLLELKTLAWGSWFYLLTQCNPKDPRFSYLEHDAETAIREAGDRLEIVRLAYWDTEHEFLRVSRFDGRVYRLDGASIEEEANGDGPIVFADHTSWVPFEPDYSGDGSVLAEVFGGTTLYEGDADRHRLLCRAWWMSLFFTELCPTRPMLVMLGEAGSGKSLSLRIPLQSLFGPVVNLQGAPDDPRNFVATVANNHLYCLDNLDDLKKDLRDRIARLTTGGNDEVRELFTTIGTLIIPFRCWMAITSRTPDTLKRDDLVDRCVFIPVERRPDNNRTREAKLLFDTQARRNLFWGDLLRELNRMVADIRQHGIPDRGGLRMEDWAALGSVFARVWGLEDVWRDALKTTQGQQERVLLEDELLVSIIEDWLEGTTYTPNEITTQALYGMLSSIANGYGNSKDASWPKGTRAFGKRLLSLQNRIARHLDANGWEMTSRMQSNHRYYRFQKKPVGGATP